MGQISCKFTEHPSVETTNQIRKSSGVKKWYILYLQGSLITIDGIEGVLSRGKFRAGRSMLEKLSVTKKFQQKQEHVGIS